MANNYAKLWAQKRINQASIQRAAEAIQRTGRALPCRVTAVSGAIVTVAFQVDSTPWTLPSITIPKAESNWIRMPTQIGDLGMTLPADALLGQISGLGTGNLPILTVPTNNLSALVFVPVSNANSAPPDQNAAVCQGPNGFLGRVEGGASSEVLVNTSEASLTFGGGSVVINSSGITLTFGAISIAITSSGVAVTGNMSVSGTLGSTGNMTAGNIDLQTHVHGGVQSGTSNTTGPAG